MLHKVILDDLLKNNLIDIINKIVLVRGDKETFYAKNKGVTPRTSHTSWIFDFRRMFLDSLGTSFLTQIISDQYRKDHFLQFATIELSSVLLSGALLSNAIKEGGSFQSSLVIRKSRKKSGLCNIIEGIYTGGDILIIDDIVNSGESLFRSIKIMKDSGISVKRVFCVVCFLNKNFLKQLHSVYPDIILDYIFDLSDFNLSTSQVKQKRLPLQIFPAHKQILTFPSFHKSLVVPKSSPLLIDGVIYIGSESGIVKAISIHDYTILWEFQIDVTRPGKNILSSIVDYGNTIIFGCYDGSLYMLDKIAGKPIKIMSISDWIGSTPCIEKTTEKIFVGMEQYGMMQGGIICLDKNLQPLWFYETSDYIHCSPLAIADTNTIVCGTNSGELLALTTDTGALLWRIQTMGAIKAGFCYIPEIQAICFGSFDKYIYCVDIISGKILWTIETKQIVFSTPIYLNGAIFIGCVDRRFYHIDIFGNILYQYETGGRIFATPVQYGDNYIVFGSNDMKLYFYNFIQKKMVLFIQHSERITTKPIFLNKKLYIEDFANRLFEYDLDSLTP